MTVPLELEFTQAITISSWDRLYHKKHQAEKQTNTTGLIQTRDRPS